MIKWWKARSRSEKVMVILIVMLVIGIILRWEYVSKEAGDSFRHRFPKQEEMTPPAIEQGDGETSAATDQ